MALFHSTPAAEAFAPPLSAMRLPQNPLTQLLQSSAVGMADEGRGKPIRTDHALARLTRREEVSLLRELRLHSPKSSMYQKVRQTLLLHNLPLVQSIVTNISNSRPQTLAMTRDDLLHEGTIGLAEAIDKYDLAFAQDEGGARLGTYATYWIRARVVRAIQSREHAVRLPERVVQASHRLVKVAREMGLEWDAVEVLAEYDVISVSQKKLRDALRTTAGIQSDGLFREAVRARSMSKADATAPLESWMSSEVDPLSFEGEGGPEHIRETLSKFLVPREVEVLSLRYGLVPAEEEGSADVQPQAFRDYQAEAEEELFGSNGILSHYSGTPDDAIAAAPEATTSRISSTSLRKSAKEAVVPTKKPALLPFKEIGRRLEYSGEYCRRTCAAALDKLVRAAEEGRLEQSDFLLGWEA
ncbi:hypothetical protein ACHAXT_002565 [Thalassiosira profunda]